MDELIEGLVKLAFGLFVIAAAVIAVLWLIGAAFWFALTALISVPAAGGAFGTMWAAEHLYCRRQVGRLKQQGKLGDMIQVHFEDSGIQWFADEERLRNYVRIPILVVILAATGVITIWIMLYFLGQAGAFQIQVGLIKNPSLANRISEIMAYVVCAAALGTAMVLLPKQLHRAMGAQATAIVQQKRHELRQADTLFCQALASYEDASHWVAQTRSVTLLKELDKRHLDLHSSYLADCIRAERWTDYENFTRGLIADLEGLKKIAQDFDNDDEPETDENPPGDGRLTEAEAYQRLNVGSGSSPEEIKKAWWDLNKKFNTTQRQALEPHILDLLEEKNKLVNEAYQLLKSLGRTS